MVRERQEVFSTVHSDQVVFPWDMSAVIGNDVWEKPIGNWFAFAPHVAEHQNMLTLFQFSQSDFFLSWYIAVNMEPRFVLGKVAIYVTLKLKKKSQ